MSYFALAVVSLLLGVDNCAAALAIALRGGSSQRRVFTVVWFTLCAAAAVAIGAALGLVLFSRTRGWGAMVGGLVLVAIGIREIVTASREQPAAGYGTSAIIGIGPAVSLDTTVASVALSLGGEPASVLVLAVPAGTAVMTLLGYEIGSRLWHVRLIRDPRSSGIAIALVGVALLAHVL
jgi:putative Mn2+ efflux pump MntP